MLGRMAATVMLCAATEAAAQDPPPSFSGTWTLNRQLSQDLAAKVKDAAGPGHMAGGPKWAEETWLPWGADFSEPERMEVRDMLIQAVPAFDTVEIEQGADEIKTVHGSGASRIFHVKRASSGTSALGDETVKRQARLEDGRLVLESQGKSSRFVEAFTLEGSPARLVYMLTLEQPRLKAPLQARLVYDRAR
jgi:hypothetical protein